MQESLSPKHGRELLSNTFEQLLNGRVVTDKGGRHLKPTGRNVADSTFDIVWDPLHEVRAILVLYVQHLLVHFLHGDASAEYGGSGEIAAMTRVTSRHHILGVEDLLHELGNRDSAILLGVAAGQGGETRHEEM